MKKLNKKSCLWLGLGLIALSNFIVLAGVAYNRSGEPIATLTLTERELRLPFINLESNENSEVFLQINFRNLNLGAPNRDYLMSLTSAWLDAAKLKTLGFDVSIDKAKQERSQNLIGTDSREVILVLEYDGEAYQQQLSAALNKLNEHTELPENDKPKAYNTPEKEYESELNYASRLFVIDAGLDLEPLQEKYTDTKKYLFMKGLVGIRFENYASDNPKVVGDVQALLLSNVQIPVEFHPVFTELPKNTARYQSNNKLPRYEVSINIGKRLEPWVTDVKKLLAVEQEN